MSQIVILIYLLNSKSRCRHCNGFYFCLKSFRLGIDNGFQTVIIIASKDRKEGKIMKTIIELKPNEESKKFIKSIDVNAIKEYYNLFVYTNENCLEIVIKGNYTVSYSLFVNRLFIENEDDIIIAVPNDILFRVFSKEGD